MKTKLTAEQRIIRQAVFRGTRTMSHLESELKMTEKALLKSLNTLKKNGMVNYEIMGRRIILHPSKHAVALFI